MEPVIVILGDINRGLRFFGPYESYVEACEEAKSTKERWNVVPLHPPFWNCKAVCVESTEDSTSYEIDLPPITSEGETDGES